MPVSVSTVFFKPDRPELALDLVRRLRGPEPQDHVDGFIDHGGGVFGLGAEELLIRGDAAGAEAEVEPALAEVVEERQPAGDVGRVVLVEANRRRPHADAPRLAQRAGDEDLRHHDVLVLHRVMLADPELAESQLLGPDDQLQVLVVALPQRLGRVVEGHDEHAVTDHLQLVAHPWSPFV